MTIGLYLGRFQPFHNGHLHIVKEALKEVEGLIIGVCYNYNKEKNPFTKGKNPFTVEEIRKMINNSLFHNGITNYIIQLIMDKPDDKDWITQIERLSKFDTVYIGDKNTEGEQWVEKCLKNKYEIKKVKSLNGIDGTTIRNNMKEKKEWKHLVPKEVYKMLEEKQNDNNST